jgi:lipoprotein-releasing system permease protein
LNLSFFIARRYLFSKKTHNVINIISGISVAGVTIGTMALIVVLSVFNGFESLVISLFNSFDPEIIITVKEGKTFDPSFIPVNKLRGIEGVKYVSQTLEENALLKYNDKQYIATVKGVDSCFKPMSRLDTMIVNGEFMLKNGDKNFAVVGYGIARYLSVSLNDMFNPIIIYVPQHNAETGTDPTKAFNSMSVLPTGIFSIQQDFDDKYIIVPLAFARELLDYPKEVSALEIGLAKDADVQKIQDGIIKIAGPQFDVKSRFQQHDYLYKIMKAEKWAVYLILAFILIIAIFNVIGSLTMLILEKKKDMSVLKSLGAEYKIIRKVFLTEGIMISMIGCIAGLALGALLCFLQQHFGLVKIQAEGAFVVSTYPVKMQALDFVYVLLTVLGIGFVAAWIPVRTLLSRKKN